LALFFVLRTYDIWSPNAREMSDTPQLRRAEGANAAQWGGAQLRAIWHNITDAVKRNLSQDILKATQTSKRFSVTLRHPFGAASALKLAGYGRCPQGFAQSRYQQCAPG